MSNVQRDSFSISGPVLADYQSHSYESFLEHQMCHQKRCNTFATFQSSLAAAQQSALKLHNGSHLTCAQPPLSFAQSVAKSEKSMARTLAGNYQIFLLTQTPSFSICWSSYLRHTQHISHVHVNAHIPQYIPEFSLHDGKLAAILSAFEARSSSSHTTRCYPRPQHQHQNYPDRSSIFILFDIVVDTASPVQGLCFTVIAGCDGHTR